jgi:peptidase E
MHLHLFSDPGDKLRNIIEVSRPYLEDKDEPTVAYLPLASLYAEKWLEYNKTAFNGLARLIGINAELMTQKEIENIIREAALVYITGAIHFYLIIVCMPVAYCLI